LNNPSAIWRWGLPVVLVALAASFALTLTSPFSAYHDFNGVIWSQSAHNNLRAGLRTTLGVPTGFYFGPLPIPAEGYYTHHPPLLPLAVTGMFAMFGEHEWAARMVPILASLASVFLLWLLLRDIAGPRAATLGAAVMAVQPMLLYLGQMVNHEMLVLPVMLATVLFLRRNRPVAAVAVLTVGFWIGWHVHLFALVLIGYWLCRREWRLALVTFGLAVLSLAMFAVVTRLVRPDAWASAWEAATRRMFDRGEAGFTLPQWLAAQGVFFTTRFVPVTWLLVLVGLLWTKRQPAVWILLLTAGIVVAGLSNFSYIHDYAGFYFLGPVGLLSGVALDQLWKRRLGPVLVAALVLVVAGWGVARADWLRHMTFPILSWESPEPRNLIPDLGREIQRTFPETMDVQLNFLPVYGPHLAYYAQRELYNNLNTFERNPDDGGVIWLDAPGAKELIASLPAGEQRTVAIDGYRFCFWMPQSAGKAPSTGRQ
jgi:hypothetical protein